MGMYSEVVRKKDLRVATESQWKETSGYNSDLGHVYPGRSFRVQPPVIYSFLTESENIKFIGYLSADDFAYLSAIARNGNVRGTVFIDVESGQYYYEARFTSGGFKYRQIYPFENKKPGPWIPKQQ